MRPESPALDAVWVPVLVDIAMMVTVVGGPLESGVLESHRPQEEVAGLERGVGHVTLVRETSVIPRGHGKAHQAKQCQEENRLPPADSVDDGIGGRAEDSDDGSQGQKEDVEPVLPGLVHVLSE